LNVDATGPVVVALPYAGGAGRVFRPLRRYLPADCALALVDLPGHGRRMAVPCVRDADTVVRGMLSALDAWPADRLVLLGYSLGGWLAYELAARLAEAGTPAAGLVVCGARAPHTGVGHPPVAHLPPATRSCGRRSPWASPLLRCWNCPTWPTCSSRRCTPT
jgi:surfactin synthase thioesterase subunit